MRNGNGCWIAFVTAPDMKTARSLSRVALKHRLAACANLVPRIESHYWWEGKVQRSNEILIIFKTTKRNLGDLQALVLKHHPYDTPEFIAFEINRGAPQYLDWISGIVAPAK